MTKCLQSDIMRLAKRKTLHQIKKKGSGTVEKEKDDEKKMEVIRLFLYVAPFIALVIIFSYYPLYGWIYAFYDYRPPKPFF